MAETNGTYPGGTCLRLKLGLAEMLKGGVIMDVMSTEQAIIAEGPAPPQSWRWSVCRR